jgi:hypothetical protein
MNILKVIIAGLLAVGVLTQTVIKEDDKFL